MAPVHVWAFGPPCPNFLPILGNPYILHLSKLLTPAKYTALTAYKTMKTLSSLIFFMQCHNPAGKTHTKMCKSKKNENQGVG
jgi:hypothetical protein